MAATAGFKQQCPSCEMLVTIKDSKLIGRQVICPRCQFRFVVVNPETETVVNPAVRAGTNKLKKVDKAAAEHVVQPKPRPASLAAGSSKEKADLKKNRTKQGADDAKPRPARKKPRLSSTVLIGGGLAGVAVIALIVGVLALLGVFGSSKRTPLNPVAVKHPNTATTPHKDGKPPSTSVQGDELISLIPLNAEVIFSLYGDRLYDDADLYSAAFGTPGAFQPLRFSRQLGLAPQDMIRFIRAENHTQSWAYNIVQLKQPVASGGTPRKELVDALRLEAARAPRGVGYYRIKEENDLLRELSNLVRLVTGRPPRATERIKQSQETASETTPRGLGLFIKDDRTFIVADLEPLLKFLDGEALTTPTPGFQTILRLHTALDNAQSRPIFCVAADTRRAGRLIRRMIVNMGLENPGEVWAFVKRCSAIGLSVHSVRRHLITGTLGVECRNDTEVASIKKVLQDSALQAKIVGYLGGLLGFTPPALGRPLPVTSQGKDVMLKVSVYPPDGGLHLPSQLSSMILRFKGSVDVATRNRHLHELADALSSYVKENGGKFPLGAVPRQAAPGSVAPPPGERLSWLVELLPYLPQFAECKSQFPFAGKGMPLSMNEKEPWRRDGNFWASIVVVPQFLTPKAAESTWRVRYPGQNYDVAATHFVGMAGVGLDAAYYLPTHPKRGIFGYDRQTALADIKNPEKTIAVIQVPPDFKTPWLAGGGSTVRGVPEKNSIRPFIRIEGPYFTAASLTAAGAGPMPQPLILIALLEWNDVAQALRPGTFAIMADGKVRFLPADMPDETFKALCTVSDEGKANIDIDKVAPLLP